MIEHMAEPGVLWLLALLPAAVLWSLARRRRAAVVFSSLDLLGTVRPGLRTRIRWLPMALRLGAAACLIVALARPREDLGVTRLSTEGIAVMLVIDRSASMTAPMHFGGRRTTRFDVVKDVLGDFVLGDDTGIVGRRGDMVGVLSFAGFAEMTAPLSRSHEAVVEAAQRVEPAPPREPLGGTAIGDALALAAAKLERAEQDIDRINRLRGEAGLPPEFTIHSKVVVLLTDGEQNRGRVLPMEAAQIAADRGIRLYTIGVGGSGGWVTIPGDRPGVRIRISDYIDEPQLRAMAELTGGRYWNAQDAQTLRQIYRELDTLERTDIDTGEIGAYEERFQRWAYLALMLLSAELVIGWTLLRRLP